MPFNLKLSSKLYLLIFAMGVFIIGTALYASFEMRAMSETAKTLYADRVFPLQELTNIRISYATGILASAEQTEAGKFNFNDALHVVREAEIKIDSNWVAFERTTLTGEEERLAKEALVLINQSKLYITKLDGILSRHDSSALHGMVNKELYENINPVIDKLNELIDLQVRVSGELYKNNSSVYSYALKRFFLLIAVFLAFAIPFASYLVTNIKRLIADLFASNIKLTESEANYRQLFNSSPAPMWVHDEKTYKFLQVNEACINNYGYSEKEFLAMTIDRILPADERNEIKDADIRKNQANAIFIDGQKHKKKSGELMDVETSSMPVMLNGKKEMLVIAIDVTEQKLYEQKLTRAAIKAQEDERYEIGGELHDNVCQILAASQLFLGMMKKSLPGNLSAYYDDALQSILLASQEVRNLSHRLAPAFFDDATLEDAFKSLLKGFNIEKKYEINLDFDEKSKQLSLGRELLLNLYRIMQEQLRNISKHANATNINVGVTMIDKKLQMRVADNGIGFDVNSKTPGIGLANMKRRAQLFSGELLVYSAEGNGCTVLVEVPVMS